MQIQLGDQLADLPSASLKQGQHTTDKTFFQATHPHPMDGNRTITQGKRARLAVAIAITAGRIDALPTLRWLASQQLGHLFLQDPLQELLHTLAGKLLKSFPRGD
jgi:hypothetical protein